LPRMTAPRVGALLPMTTIAVTTAICTAAATL
jgi:hypothetical protein